MSGVVCVVCPFADDEKLKNIHDDLALLVWGPALISTHAPLPPKPISLPLSHIFFHPPLFSHCFPSFPPFCFCPLSFSSFFLPWPPLFFFLVLSTFFLCVCACVCVSRMYVSAYLAIPCVSANDDVKHTKSNISYDNTINKNETNVKYTRIHVYEYKDWMFASNLSHRDRKPKYISKFWAKHGGDGKRWPLTPFPFLAPSSSRPPAIETVVLPVAGHRLVL